MKNIKSLIFLWLFSFSPSSCSVIQAVAVARKIIRTQHPHSLHGRLMTHLKTTSIDQLNRKEDLLCIFNALLKLPTAITPFKTPLKTAVTQFDHVPGFLKNLQMIVAQAYDEKTVNGYAYEIERALALADTGEPIVAFNKMFHTESTSRQIDILTQNYAVECKNIKWQCGRRNKLQKQFLEQKAAVAHHNFMYNRNYTFQVSSRQAIPEYWQKWFDKHDIDLHEDQPEA